MVKVLFVCTGNICRSPSAEGIFRKLVQDQNLQGSFLIDSAGLLDYHEGEGADKRTIEHAIKRGYDFSDIVSRPITREDFREFDYMIAMDHSHLKAMNELCPDAARDKVVIQLMMDYSEKWKGQDVPDPYYSGEDGFELVLDMLEESCNAFLDHLKSRL